MTKPRLKTGNVTFGGGVVAGCERGLLGAAHTGRTLSVWHQPSFLVEPGPSMFSQTVEYALRATVHLAMHSHIPLRTADIAESTKIPLAYLSKILQGLQRGRIVHLQRGIGGGVKLAVPPEQLTVLDVVNAIDPIKRIEHCPLNIASHSSKLCELHQRLDDSMHTLEKDMGSITLSQLVLESAPNHPLCTVASVPSLQNSRHPQTVTASDSLRRPTA